MESDTAALLCRVASLERSRRRHSIAMLAVGLLLGAVCAAVAFVPRKIRATSIALEGRDPGILIKGARSTLLLGPGFLSEQRGAATVTLEPFALAFEAGDQVPIALTSGASAGPSLTLGGTQTYVHIFADRKYGAEVAVRDRRGAGAAVRCLSLRPGC